MPTKKLVRKKKKSGVRKRPATSVAKRAYFIRRAKMARSNVRKGSTRRPKRRLSAKDKVKRRVTSRSLKRKSKSSVIKGKGPYNIGQVNHAIQKKYGMDEEMLLAQPHDMLEDLPPPMDPIDPEMRPRVPRVTKLPVYEVDMPDVDIDFSLFDEPADVDLSKMRKILNFGTADPFGYDQNAKGPDYISGLKSDLELDTSPITRMYRKYRNSNFVKKANKYVPKGTFRTIGGMVGGPLGAYAGSKFAELAGFGAYTVKRNSIMLGEGQSPAYMHSSSSSTTIRHREYITDIVSANTPNAFRNQQFPINPGLVGSFPWLASIAQNYEQYRIKGMVFEYKSNYADAIASSAANSSIGYVIMGTNYNSLASPFVSKQQMDNTEYTTSAKPSVSFYHPIECEPMSKPTNNLFVRSGDAPFNSDLRMYDLGNFQVASGGISASQVVLGELWCSYEIEFLKPVSYVSSGFTILSDHWQLDPNAIGVAAAFGLDTVDGNLPVNGSSIGGTITGSGTIYNFPLTIVDGNYMCIYHVDGSSTSTPIVPSVSINNGNLMSLWISDTLSAATTNGTGTGGKLFLCFVVNVNVEDGQPCQIIMSGGTFPSIITGGDFFVTQIDADIVT